MSASRQKITALISSRKNSKYLAKFVLGLWVHTLDPMAVRAMVIMNEHDTWNDDLVAFMAEMDTPLEFHVEFERENLRLGRAGLHEYFNMLLVNDALLTDWTVYFCDDHYVVHEGWEQELLAYVDGKKLSGDSEGKAFPLDPDQVWVLVPKFDNAGAMNHIVSRGFIRALGGKIGRHGWIDSYINDLMRPFPDRVIRIDEEWFHDFTHDKPSPMSDAHMQGESTDKGKLMPAYDSNVTRHRLRVDQEAITKALEREARS